MLWTFEDFVSAMRATPFLPEGATPAGVTGLSIDTRTLAPGDAYFAIKGENHDGHDFVDAAREAGAACAVVARDHAKASGGMPVVIVEDVVEALGLLGQAARARTNALVVAVTGSVGKTTTKEMLARVLAPSGRVHAAVASFNNHWGVPLTLARMPADTDYAVIEIGMNHPGEITPLVKMARPHVAAITRIAPAHLGAFASVDEIAMAKAEILSGLEPGGVALLNSDDGRTSILRGEAERLGIERIVTFGSADDADVRLRDSDGRITVAGQAHDLRIGATGHHIAMNAACALAAAFLVGADVGAGAAALADFSAGKGRGERHVLPHPDGDILLIDESYNANPASMLAGIQSLLAVEPGEGGRRIAIMGDMLELGERSPELHAYLADPLSTGVDEAWLVGSEMLVLADRLESATPGYGQKPVGVRHFGSTPELATIIADEVRGHDVVMVKSSLGLRFATLVDALTAAYPPRPNNDVG